MRVMHLDADPSLVERRHHLKLRAGVNDCVGDQLGNHEQQVTPLVHVAGGLLEPLPEPASRLARSRRRWLQRQSQVSTNMSASRRCSGHFYPPHCSSSP